MHHPRPGCSRMSPWLCGETRLWNALLVESDPQCTTNLSSTDDVRVSETYMLSCKIIYRGQLSPRVTWFAYNDSRRTQVTASPPAGARSIAMSVSVCLSFCMSVRSHISKNDTSNLHEIFCMCQLWPWLGPLLTCYVLPVLRMTSYVHIMGHMTRCIGNNDVGAVLKRVVKISHVLTSGRHFVLFCRCMQCQ